MMSYSAPDTALTTPLNLGGDGLNVAVKECLAVAGLPTRCGSASLAESPPETVHSDVVRFLLQNNCRLIGTANMHELAFGVTGLNRYLGTPVNPKWPDRIPGGSSSGSAVLAARGVCDFTLGTDTGGSIRLPAACCGIYGLKPTYGSVSRKGALPMTSSLDCIGPLARQAPMITRAMSIIDPNFTPLKRDTAPRLKRLQVEADHDIQTAVDNCLADFNDETIEIDRFHAAYDAGLTLIKSEQYAAFGALATTTHQIDEDVRTRILSGKSITPEQVAAANLIRTDFSAEIDRALTDTDILVLPTVPCVPPTLEHAQDMCALVPLTRLVRPFNLSGHPAMTLPISVADGLPAGLQIVAAKGHDAQLCAIGEWLATNIHSIQENTL